MTARVVEETWLGLETMWHETVSSQWAWVTELAARCERKMLG